MRWVAWRRLKPMPGIGPSSPGRASFIGPVVRQRIERGASQSAFEYVELRAARATIIRRMNVATAEYDAPLLPTCPLVPPPIADLQNEAEYNRINMLQLRNTALGNVLDRCAISLPCHAGGEAPGGLMLMCEPGADARLFSIAASVEAALG